ncbi:MAG: metal-dependent hydrolase with the TIM-barrel fold protein [Deltaproteobacteria bacterium]|nr:MAG: metal-dependent hydrolase with the TIM-barrel fold protein [Deltaproteobacteria bacterium]
MALAGINLNTCRFCLHGRFVNGNVKGRLMRIYHGKIITLDADNRIFNYLVEDQGRIVHVGDLLPREYQHNHSTVELGSRVLLPSFGDGHMHFSNWALIAVSSFDVRKAKTIRQIQDIVRQFMARNKKAKAIIAFGASKHSVMEKRLIVREELDEVCPDIPLILICYDGHSAICNTRLMEKFPDKVKQMAGFQADTGQLFREAYFAGTDYASSLVPPLELVRSIIKGFDLLAEKGIGLIHATEGIGFPRDLDVTLVSLIARAQTRRNRFQTRLFFQTLDVDKALKRNLPRIGGCFATAIDGCFGACDAALHEPYQDNPGNRGHFFQGEADLIAFVKKANRAGLQVEMHAIGDAAVSRAVKAIESALVDFPRKDHRHTIIHACLIRPAELKKIAELGIGITLQPGFLISPLEPAEYLHDILGSRVNSSSPLRSIIDAGIHLSGGSDAPVIDPDPIEGIYGACNHPYDPDQSVSITEALKMFTCEVAWTTFDERERGSLEKGKIADMVILNQDPLRLDPGELRSLQVEKLFLHGKAYQPGMGLTGMLWHAYAGRKEKV